MTDGRPALTADELDFLHRAMDLARDGDTAQLAALIEAGLPVNLTDAAGNSLLILAAYHAHSATVRMLVEHGADTERVNDRGQTALGAAVFRRSAADVVLLLGAGADPDRGRQSAHAVAHFFELADMQELLRSYPAA